MWFLLGEVSERRWIMSCHVILLDPWEHRRFFYNPLCIRQWGNDTWHEKPLKCIYIYGPMIYCMILYFTLIQMQYFTKNSSINCDPFWIVFILTYIRWLSSLCLLILICCTYCIWHIWHMTWYTLFSPGNRLLHFCGFQQVKFKTLKDFLKTVTNEF